MIIIHIPIRICLLLIALAMCFTACLAQPSHNGGEPSRNDLLQNTPSISLLPPSDTIGVATTASTNFAPSSTPTPQLSSTPVLATQSPALSATPKGVVLRTECPSLINSNSPLWSHGSILFNKGTIWSDDQPEDIAEQSSVWAISANTQIPGLIFDSTNGGWVSPDGSIFMSTKRDAENLTLEVLLYNLMNNEEHHLKIPYDFRFQNWLPDGRVQFIGQVERVEDFGERFETIIIDPATQKSEKITKELKLPDFAFNDSEAERFGLFYGYDALDPTGQLILYSAQNDSVDNFEVRLLNLQSGEIIWQQDSLNLSSISPQWSIDGNHVIFDTRIPIVDSLNSWNKIIGLSRNGEMEILPPQPFPFVSEGELSGYSRSPSGRYIFYIAIETDIQTFSVQNRAFIIDTQTWEVREICSPENTYVAPIPAGTNVGYWLPNDQYIYRLVTKKEGQLAHSLYVLDIPTWETQLVFESEPGYGLNILGWTPVEYPGP